MNIRYTMNKSFFKILSVLILPFLSSITLAQEIGSKTKLKWELVDNNHEGQKRSLTRLSMLNDSDHALGKQGWNLWFSNMRSIDVSTVTGDFSVEHINGDLYKLSPTSQFKGLAPGDSLQITMVIKGRIPNFTDAVSGLYFTFDQQKPAIQAIPNPQLLPFKNAFYANDMLIQQFEKNEKVKNENASSLLKIIPSPKEMKLTGLSFALDRSVKIGGANDFEPSIQLLKETIASNLKTQSLATKNNSAKSIEFINSPKLGKEAYEINIEPKKIIIKAATNTGAFYAVQSLFSLLPLNFFEGGLSSVDLPTLVIADEPRLAYRGFLMDIARNFQEKKQVLKLIDLMASYKLNVLHMHLNDDEGWRIEIPSLPELTEVGSKRSGSWKDGKTLQPSYGSGAIAKSNQFLTKADFIEILHYATKNHIQVIPEIETPGHARAAIRSMEYRAKKGKGAPISDPMDQSKFTSAQYWKDNVIDAGLASSYEFIETVVDDFIEMYKEAGLELKIISLGGDETPRGSWAESPSIHKLMKEQNIANHHLVWPYYVQKILDIVNKKGVQLAGWEEFGMVNLGKGMKPNPDLGAKNISLDVWNNLVGGGNEDLAYRLANLGYPVVFTSAHNFYLDFAWSDNYLEPGHNWAGYIDLEKSYGFMVHNFLRNLTPEMAAVKEPLTEIGKKNIYGIKGVLFSEKVLDVDRFEYMLVPRVFALAERAWAAEPEWEKSSQTNWKPIYDRDWSIFANTVGLKELPKVEKRLNFNYKLPSIGIKQIDGKVACNLEWPGFYIVYTVDGSEPVAGGMKYSQPIAAKGILKFKVFSSTGKSSYTTVYPNN